MTRQTPRTPHRWTDADDETLERAVGTLAARGLPPRVDPWSAICGLLAAEGLGVTPSAAATRYHRLVERHREEEAERQRRASEDTLIGSLTSTLPGGECPCGTGLWRVTNDWAECRSCGRTWNRQVQSMGAPGPWEIDPATVPAEPAAPRVLVDPDAWERAERLLQEYEESEAEEHQRVLSEVADRLAKMDDRLACVETRQASIEATLARLVEVWQ